LNDSHLRDLRRCGPRLAHVEFDRVERLGALAFTEDGDLKRPPADQFARVERRGGAGT